MLILALFKYDILTDNELIVDNAIACEIMNLDNTVCR